jgi:hypothetical protein
MPGGQHQTDEAAREWPITAGRDRRAVAMCRATSSAAGAPHESARIAARGLPSESRDLHEVIAVIGNRRNQIAPDAGRRPDPGHEDNVVTLAFDGDGDPARGKRAEGSGFEGESATGEGG